MLVKPTVLELLEKVDNRFRLVTITAKRARQIAGGSTPSIYGYSNVFYQLNSINEKNIDEQFVSEIRPEQIRMISDKNIKPIGTHTYSIVGDYEVIDLEYLDFNYKKWIR